MPQPDFIEKNRKLSKIWNACTEEMEGLHHEACGRLSLWSFFIEKNRNKLAHMSRNKEVQLKSNETNFLKKYPYFGGQFQLILENGMRRDKALTTALNSIYFYNKNACLNETSWKNILGYLDEKSLKNITQVASLFFKPAPANNRSQFFTAPLPSI